MDKEIDSWMENPLPIPKTIRPCVRKSQQNIAQRLWCDLLVFCVKVTLISLLEIIKLGLVIKIMLVHLLHNLN